jgi:hypothetical protein
MSDDAKTKPLMTKPVLIEHINEAFEALTLFIQDLSDQEFVEPIGGGSWSWKDTVAHIAAWEQILVHFHIGGKSFDQVIGMEGAQYRITSYDEVNEHLYKLYQDLSTEEVRVLLLETHELVMAALDTFPEDQLHQPHPELSMGEAASVNWIDYITANTYEHYEEHLSAS